LENIGLALFLQVEVPTLLLFDALTAIETVENSINLKFPLKEVEL
jgi:hypothetical protein